MRRAKVYLNSEPAGILEEEDNGKFKFSYLSEYGGDPISMTMPTSERVYEFDGFPPFFDGLLPEGFQLEALLKKDKIDRKDFFSQLVTVGADFVGAITIEEIK